MLQVTSRAAAVLNEQKSQQGIPESFGLRVQQDRSDSSAGLRLEFAEAPVPGDEVGETEGVRVFVAPDIAEVLGGRAIDASEGSGLVLRDQSEVAE